MKKFKKHLIIVVAVFVGVIIGACSFSTTKAEQKWPIKIWFQNENGKMETYQVVDEETGVNYIVISGELRGQGLGTAITPRLNADGSLYVSK